MHYSASKAQETPLETPASLMLPRVKEKAIRLTLIPPKLVGSKVTDNYISGNRSVRMEISQKVKLFVYLYNTNVLFRKSQSKF